MLIEKLAKEHTELRRSDMPSLRNLLVSVMYTMFSTNTPRQQGLKKRKTFLQLL